MFRNYLKTSLRNLKKYYETSIINILGLAVGMAAFILLYEYAKTEWSYEDFHENSNRIYRITTDFYNGKEYLLTDCETIEPVGPYLKDQSPDIKDFVRFYHNGNVVVDVDNKKFGEPFLYLADGSMFDVFGYELKSGDPKRALHGKNKVVISEKLAEKYFGTHDVLGRSLQIKTEFSSEFFEYEVTGILKNIPLNTHLKFDMLISHETVQSFGITDEWDGGNNTYTYLLLEDNFDLKRIESQISKMLETHKNNLTNRGFRIEPIADIHLYSKKTFEPEANGDARTVKLLFGVALLLLLISWINYVNITTARSITRAKEVGVRKVTGSERPQLVFQFLTETMITSLLAFFLALVIALFAMPWFRELSGQDGMQDIFPGVLHMPWLLLLPLTITLMAGTYPAFVLSRFEPLLILKGKFNSSSSGIFLRKFLSVAQFSAVILLTICTLTVYYQLNHLKNKDLGVDIEKILYMDITSIYEEGLKIDEKLSGFKAEIEALPNISSCAWSGAVPGSSSHDISTTSRILRPGKEFKDGSSNYYHYDVSEDFFDLMGAESVAGSIKTIKNTDQVIFNEEAIKALGFLNADEAIGSKVYWGSAENIHTISGVVKNFHQFSPKSPFVPMAFYPSRDPEYFVIKMGSVDHASAISSLEKVWEKHFSDKLFNYQFIDDQYDKQYRADERLGKVALTFTILTIFIAVLGLYGLVSFHIAQKMKEISIRKILGAPIFSLYTMLTKDVVVLILISGLLAIPSGYVLISDWLEGFASAIALNADVFILPVLIILFVSLLTIGIQTTKAILANPTDTLQNE
ncbi:MAG: FtsX-like permease family protein [Bacteroidota bacterium]